MLQHTATKRPTHPPVRGRSALAVVVELGGKLPTFDSTASASSTSPPV